MGAMASQIASLTIVCSTVYSGADQRKHQSSASLAFVRGIHRWPVNSPHKWSVTRKMFPFDDVIMTYRHHVTNANRGGDEVPQVIVIVAAEKGKAMCSQLCYDTSNPLWLHISDYVTLKGCYFNILTLVAMYLVPIPSGALHFIVCASGRANGSSWGNIHSLAYYIQNSIP